MKPTEIAMVKIDLLLIDTYQRPLNTERVERNRKMFDIGAVKAISVSRRADGSLYVYDGHHTLELYRAMGYTEVPAIICKGDYEQEAKWFMLINGAGTSKANSRENYRAALAAKDKNALEVNELLKSYSIEVATGGALKGTTSAINSILKWHLADRARLVRAMDVIDRLWSEEDSAWTQVVMRGMWELSISEELIEVVERCLRKYKVTPRRILDTAQGMQSSTGTTGGGSAYVKKAILKLAKVNENQYQ